MTGKPHEPLHMAALILLLGVASCGGDANEAGNQAMADNVSATAGTADDPNVAHQETPPDNVVYQSTFGLNQRPAQNEPMLRGGRVATTAQWPASFYAVFQTPRGRASCTSALIGPKVMMTAAHCIPSNGSVSFIFTGTAYRMSCSAHPGWLTGSDPSADYALCKLVDNFSPPAGFRFESVDTRPMQSMTNQSIILTGFGCISDAVADTRTDGKYRIGLNTVDETSASTAPRRDPRYYSAQGNQKNNLFTTDTGANVCPGDSGGPAFRRTATTGTGEYLQRKIVGVNSRVFYRDSQRRTYGSSLISSTGTPDFRNWAMQWLNREGLDACGLRGAITACRT